MITIMIFDYEIFMKKKNNKRCAVLVIISLIVSIINQIGFSTIAKGASVQNFFDKRSQFSQGQNEQTNPHNLEAGDFLNASNHQMIVKLKEGTKDQLSISGCTRELLMENMYLLTAHTQEQWLLLMDMVQHADYIEYVQPNYNYSTKEVVRFEEIPSDIPLEDEDIPTQNEDTDIEEDSLPNDIYFPRQWGLYNTGSERFDNIDSVSGVDVDILDTWREYNGTNEVVVAVIDTGVDYKHEDLKDSMWINTKEIQGNGMDDDGNGYVDDIYGWDFYNDDNTICHYAKDGKKDIMENDDHGTHCAGIIAAQANNGVGIAGVASMVDVKIMALKVLGGKKGVTSTDMAVRAIRYAISMGANIISASWGSTDSFDGDQALLNAIKTSGILFVAAAGNEGSNNDTISTIPACYSYLDNVIAVGSVDCNGELSEFSNYGQSVDLVAPGNSIASTIVGSYAYMSGTSMAAPMVAGIAAFLYGAEKNSYPRTVKGLLLTAYDELPTIDQSKISHAGIINAYKAYGNIDMLELDITPPSITGLRAEVNGLITVKVSDKQDRSRQIYSSGISAIRIAKGKKSVQYFQNGTKGEIVSSDKYTTKSSGIFTVYVRDYAGNETIKTITADKEAPVITAKVNAKKVVLTVTDQWSKVSFVRYETGKKTAAYFNQGKKGKKVSIQNSKGSFTAQKAGLYTIYAIDGVGNQRLRTVRIK